MIMVSADIIGPYSVCKLLGKGGMGAVYLVLDPISQQSVALKMMHATLSDDLDRLRFEREFRLASGFDHPNLVKVHDMGYWQGQPYYTMEYIQGRDFRQHLEEALRALSWPDWLLQLGSLTCQLLAGLDYIHSKHVVHRDLKPDNVLVDERGAIRLVDFGLARDTLASRHTLSGTAVGTPHYMSPEQLAGTADGRADLYALGVMIYELLSGRLPHPGRDLREVIFHLMSRPAEPLLPLGPIPQELQQLVESLLDSQPDRRPSGCQEVLRGWLQLFPQDSVAVTGPRLQLFFPVYQGQHALMLDAQALLSRGRGLLVVRGASGAGKSRYLEEVACSARRANWQVAQSGCGDWEAFPYGPWIEVLRAALPEGLPAALEDQRSTLAVLLPELGQPASLGEAGKFRLFRAMQGVLTNHPRRLILLDDIEKLDAVSQDFLEFLHKDERLVIIATADTSLQRYADNGGRLDNLTLEQSRALAESVLGQGLREADADELWSRCGRGNPLMLVETLRSLFEEGKLELHEGHVCVDSTRLTLPGSVRQVLERRLYGLPDAERERLAWLAAWGSVVEFEWLARFYADCSQADLLDQLEALVQRQLVLHEGHRYWLLPQLGPVLLDTLPASQRRRLHQALAIHLAGLEDTNDERIGLHWLAADRPAEALQPLLRAAHRQVGLFNYPRALELYELVEAIPGSQCRELKADALMGAQRTAEALQIYLELQLNSPSLALRVKEARCYWCQGELARVYDLLCEVTRGLDGPPPSRSWWSYTRVSLEYLYVLGGLTLARRDASEAERDCRMLLANSLYFLRPKNWEEDTLALMMSDIRDRRDPREAPAKRQMLLGSTLLVGPWASVPRARQALRRAADICLELPPSRGQVELLGDILFFVLLTGMPEGMELARRAWEISEKLGERHCMMQCAALTGYYHRISGRLLEADRWGDELWQLARETQNRLELAHCCILRSIVHSLRGQTEAAAENLEQSVAITEVGYFGLQQEVARAYLYLMRGDLPASLEAALPKAALYGADVLQIWERQTLQIYGGGPQRPAHMARAASQYYPIYRATGLRLSGQFEAALSLCREWDFPLEEGLCLIALERRDEGLEALQRSGLGQPMIERILTKPGSYPLDRR